MPKYNVGDKIRYRWKGIFGNKFEAETYVCAVDDKGRPGTPTVGSMRYVHFHEANDDIEIIERTLSRDQIESLRQSCGCGTDCKVHDGYNEALDDILALMSNT